MTCTRFLCLSRASVGACTPAQMGRLSASGSMRRLLAVAKSEPPGRGQAVEPAGGFGAGREVVAVAAAVGSSAAVAGPACRLFGCRDGIREKGRLPGRSGRRGAAAGSTGDGGPEAAARAAADTRAHSGIRVATAQAGGEARLGTDDSRSPQNRRFRARDEAAGTPGQAAAAKQSQHRAVRPVKENGPIFVGWPKPQAGAGDYRPAGRLPGAVRLRRAGPHEGRHEPPLHLLPDRCANKGWPVVGLDVGDIAKGFGPQAELKFQTAVEGMRKMGYEGITLGPTDLRLPAGVAGLGGGDAAAQPLRFRQRRPVRLRRRVWRPIGSWRPAARRSPLPACSAGNFKTKSTTAKSKCPTRRRP